MPEDANERIDNGELVIVFDGEKYKIGRGVNSLTSFTPEHGQDFSKIKIIEGVDLYQDDIRETFESSYVGKVINDYDNKQALVAAILAYHRELEGNVLDRTFDNTAAIDVEAPGKPICRARAPTPLRWTKPPWPRRTPAPRSLSPAMSSLWTRWKI